MGHVAEGLPRAPFELSNNNVTRVLTLKAIRVTFLSYMNTT